MFFQRYCLLKNAFVNFEEKKEKKQLNSILRFEWLDNRFCVNYSKKSSVMPSIVCHTKLYWHMQANKFCVVRLVILGCPYAWIASFHTVNRYCFSLSHPIPANSQNVFADWRCAFVFHHCIYRDWKFHWNLLITPSGKFNIIKKSKGNSIRIKNVSRST